MAEHEPQVHSPEHQPSNAENSAEQREKLERLKHAAEKAPHHLAEAQESLSHAAKQEALTAQEVQGKVGEKEKPKVHVHEGFAITRATKKAAYKKTLNHVRRQLPKREKAFSKVIHQPAVEKLSEVGAKTVARPSGLLVGGICALIGSSVVFYMSKHYGFRYNFFVFFLLLTLGFGLGLLLELFWNSTKKLRRHHN